MSGLNLSIVALTLPEGTEFPGTMQELEDLVVQYLVIAGTEDFTGVAYGDTEPIPDNRDLWWATTDGSGNPLGWKAWDGDSWEYLPVVLRSGVTSERPSSPPDYTIFQDTEIECTIIYYDGTWHTQSGTPGDIKYVAGATLSAVLTKNPGWSHFTDGIGRVLAGAAADGSDAQTNVGTNSLTLTEDQLPAHTHSDIVLTGSDSDNGDAGDFVITSPSASIGLRTIANSVTGSTGAGDSIDIRNAQRILFCLIKD